MKTLLKVFAHFMKKEMKVKQNESKLLLLSLGLQLLIFLLSFSVVLNY